MEDMADGILPVAAADHASPPLPDSAHSVTWARIGRWAAYLGAFGLLAESVLFLLDTLNVLAPAVREPAPGANADLRVATHYAGWFARQHSIWWDIAVRDSVGPLGLLSLVVAVVALVCWLRRSDPAAVLLVLLFGMGALLSAGSDLAYLNLVSYWRFDWSHATTTNMIASGRAVEAIDSITFYPQAAGYVLLALALCCLWALARTEPRIPRWVAWVALLEAAALPLVVLTSIVGPDPVYSILALLTGVVLGPLLAVGLARTLSPSSSGHRQGLRARAHLVERSG
jgi:hypothetical protein